MLIDVVLLLVVAVPSPASSPVPPNGELVVAYRQLEAGKLSEPFWEATLRCWEGSCMLTVIGFGSCMGDARMGRGWQPWSRTIGTGTEEFVLTRVADSLIEAEERGSGTTIKYRWSFTTVEDTDARKEGRRQTRLFAGLIAFSGAAVRSSPLLDRPTTWELVPFKGARVRVRPACEMFVAGVPE